RVPPDLAAVRVDDGSVAQQPGSALGEHRAVVAAGHEAELLAVGLCGDREPERLRLLAHALLRRIAEREARRRPLLLRQRVEDVRLVLPRVDSAEQARAAAGARRGPRVVARRDRL